MRALIGEKAGGAPAIWICTKNITDRMGWWQGQPDPARANCFRP